MNNFNKRLIIGVLGPLALGLGVAGNASATAYGYASDNVVNFDITLVGSPGLTSSTTLSQSSAFHDGYPPSGGFDPLDAPPAYAGSGVAPANNDFSQKGQVDDYNRADAVISNPFVEAGTGAAQNIAEGYSPDQHGGVSTAANSLAGQFTIGAGGGSIEFNFDATPFMEVWAGVKHDQATAQLEFTISIEDITGLTVFNWTPDGISGNDALSGGNDVENGGVDDQDASLNEVLTAFPGDHLFHNESMSTFSYANGIALAAGTYNLSIGMVETVNQTGGVPLPGSLLLLGLGLAGLGTYRRKR